MPKRVKKVNKNEVAIPSAPPPLSVVKLRFINAYMRTEDEVRAYRETHVVADEMTDAQVRDLANAILADQAVDAKLQAYYNSRLQRVLEPWPVLPQTEGKTDLQVQLEKCVIGQAEALRQGNLAAYATLVKQESELKGLLVSKSEVKVVKVNEMSRDELKEALDEAERTMRELGLEPAAAGGAGRGKIPATKH